MSDSRLASLYLIQKSLTALVSVRKQGGAPDGTEHEWADGVHVKSHGKWPKKGEEAGNGKEDDARGAEGGGQVSPETSGGGSGSGVGKGGKQTHWPSTRVDLAAGEGTGDDLKRAHEFANSRGIELKAVSAIYHHDNGNCHFELDPKHGAGYYHDTLERLRLDNPAGPQVTLKSVDDFKGMRLFVSEDSTAVVALDGIDMVSACSNPKPGEKPNFPYMMQSMIEQGGRTGDCYGTFLPEYYARFGLEMCARLPWSQDTWDEYMAPARKEGKFSEKQMDSKQVFADYNNGKPDYYLFAFTGNKVYREPDSVPLVDDWDKAVEIRDKVLKEHSIEKAAISIASLAVSKAMGVFGVEKGKAYELGKKVQHQDGTWWEKGKDGMRRIYLETDSPKSPEEEKKPGSSLTKEDARKHYDKTGFLPEGYEFDRASDKMVKSTGYIKESTWDGIKGHIPITYPSDDPKKIVYDYRRVSEIYKATGKAPRGYHVNSGYYEVLEENDDTPEPQTYDEAEDHFRYYGSPPEGWDYDGNGTFKILPRDDMGRKTLAPGDWERSNKKREASIDAKEKHARTKKAGVLADATKKHKRGAYYTPEQLVRTGWSNALPEKVSRAFTSVRSGEEYFDGVSKKEKHDAFLGMFASVGSSFSSSEDVGSLTKKEKLRMFDAYAEMLESARMVRATHFETLKKVLFDGDRRFLNQFKTSKSSGAYTPSRRVTVENKLSGVSDWEEEERPVYGFIIPDGVDPENGICQTVQYGDCHVVFKDRVKDRTTICEEDSLGDHTDIHAMTGIGLLASMDRCDMSHRADIIRKMHACIHNDVRTAGYIETQMWGGAMAEDIESIYVDDYDQAEKLLAKGKKNGIKHGIKVRVRSTGEEVEV